MIVETLTDWNNLLAGCGCCSMPTCPVPARECETIYGSLGSVGWYDPDDTTWIIYKKFTYASNLSESSSDESGTYSCTSHETYVSEYADLFGGSVNSGYGGCPTYATPDLAETCSTSGSSTKTGADYEETRTRTQTSGTIAGDPCAWTDTRVFTDISVDPPDVTTYYDYNTLHTTIYPYADPVHTITATYETPQTYAQWMSAAFGTLSADMTDFDTCGAETFGDCAASYAATEEPETGGPGDGVSLSLVAARFRWAIPNTHSGSFFKITWDVAFFPATGDPSAVSTDNTWEWTGPGDPEEEASWKSDWYEIPIPTEPGENRVVNVRYECYRSTKFGMKPQVTGEAVTLP
jgi:hypothetical protein